MMTKVVIKLDGKRLKKLRNERGLTQKELSKVLSVTSETLSKYELNKSSPSDPIKVAIAQFFDISLDYLLGVVDEPFSLDRIAYNMPKGASSYSIGEINEFAKYLNFKNTYSDDQKELINLWALLKSDQRLHFLGLLRDLNYTR
jgi:transcriptional regulator with XRE-family HTH domain